MQEVNRERITIVTPAFNAEFHIAELYLNLQPILNNKINWIVVNDCSDDKTSSLLIEISKKNINVQHYDLPENSGPHYARYYGVQKAQGAYILLLDVDDLLHIKNCMDFFEFIFKNNSFDYYYAPSLTIKDRQSFTTANFNKKSKKTIIKKPTDFIFNKFPNQSSILLHKNFYIRCYRNINLPWGEDMLFYLTISQTGIGVMWEKPISSYIITGQGRGNNLLFTHRCTLFSALFKQSLFNKKINSIIYSTFLTIRFTFSFIYKKALNKIRIR